MIDQMKRILKLVRKTGDTMVVTDPNGEDVYVVMNLDQYENLLEMTDFNEDEHQIDDQETDFSWREPEMSNIQQISTDPAPDIWDTMKPAGSEGETWDMAAMSESELANLEQQYKDFAAKSVSEAISESVQASSDPKPDESKNPGIKEKEEDFGEEQFYLEPID
ncbi:MAG: hypothetical protein AAB664_00715 [Patescibacteria group bacterium]